MSTRLGWVGWIVGAIAVIAAVALGIWGQQNAREAADLRGRLSETTARVEKLAGDVERGTTTIQKLEAKVTAVEQAAAARSAAPAPDTAGGGDATAAFGSDPKQLFGKMMAAMAAGDKKGEGGAGAGDEDMGALVAKLYSGEGGKQMAKISADMGVNMMYGQFFTDLHLPPETEKQVRDLISSNMADAITAGVEMMGKGMTEEKRKELEGMEGKLRSDLSAVLTPEQLQAWDAYQQTMPERALNQSLEMQLNMFGSGMTPENRDMARQVLVEEMLPSQPKQGMNVPGAVDMQDYVGKQQEAFTRAHDRLAQQLEPDQLAQFDQFTNQMQQMVEMSARFMAPAKTEGAPAAPAQTPQP